MFHHVQHHLRRDVGGVIEVLDGLIDRHGADGHRRSVDDGLADGVDVAAGGQVHDGVGAEMNRHVELFQFLVDLARDGRIADVGVDLATDGDADAQRFQALLQMNGVGGDDHAAAGHLVADEFDVEILAVGDETHFIGNNALAGGFDLSHGK